MAIVAEHSIGRVWQEEGERNGDAFRFLNGTDPTLQIPLQSLVEEQDMNGWVVNQEKFYCNTQCWKNLTREFRIKERKGCLESGEFITLSKELSKSKSIENNSDYCFRILGGRKRVVSTYKPRKDKRIICRPVGDTMTWYRGWQAFTIRNPNNDSLGPWCFIADGKQIAREPCFHPCISTIKTLCLSKAFFPFYQKPYDVDGYPKNPISPKILRNVIEKHLREENEAVDLSDILDVPSVVNSIGLVRSLFTPGQTTRHLTFAANRGHVVGYRKKCHQTGVRTLIAGPWAPISIKKLPFSIKDRGSNVNDLQGYFSSNPYLLKLNAEYALTNILSGQQGIYKPWKPCFFACDDSTIKLQYFGDRSVNWDNRRCLIWAESCFNNILFRRRSIEFLNSRCLDMSILIEYEKAAPSIDQNVFENFYTKGPGCFFRNPDHSYLEYLPCFRTCPCNKPSMQSPPSVIQQLCSNGNKFGTCAKFLLHYNIFNIIAGYYLILQFFILQQCLYLSWSTEYTATLCEMVSSTAYFLIA
uniref:Kringle domain-containing protein n=1 Tax=Heterorhabditis bacteriophora TaxID=37862 RepID=A0A1I7WY23_HETBA